MNLRPPGSQNRLHLKYFQSSFDEPERNAPGGGSYFSGNCGLTGIVFGIVTRYCGFGVAAAETGSDGSEVVLETPDFVSLFGGISVPTG